MVPRYLVRAMITPLLLLVMGCAVKTYDGKTYHNTYAQTSEGFRAYLDDGFDGLCDYRVSDPAHRHCLTEYAELTRTGQNTAITGFARGAVEVPGLSAMRLQSSLWRKSSPLQSGPQRPPRYANDVYSLYSFLVD
jgi:hypothetical protein